jgi:hypothetical protein
MTQSASSPSFTVRRAADRGRAEHGWLSSRHTFSFADYHDPRWMGFRALRVINDDRVAAAKGFGTHGHKDMEIVSYVLAGELGHKDSMGNGSVIVPGDVQRMSAGTGVLHSEMNPSPTSPVHFLQIWIQPSERGIAPGYEQKRFSREDKLGVMRLVASPDGSAGSVVIHADARLYASIVEAGTSVTHAVPSGRHTWIHVAKGEVTLGDLTLDAGDAAFSSDAGTFTLSGDGEVLVFDLG